MSASGRRIGRLGTFALIPVVALVVTACGAQENNNPTSDEGTPGLFEISADNIGFPHEVVTVEGAQSASLYLPIFLVAVVIFLLVEGLLIFMAIRFRRRKSDELPTQTHGNNTLEIIWTAIPAAIVTILFVSSMFVLTDVNAKSDDPPVTVDVTAFQWQWTFDYPEYDMKPLTGQGKQGPEMVVPVEEAVRVRLEAVDVIHSFYVPAFFYKLDAIPGQVNEFEFTVTEPGTYGGQCAEFCGMQHGDMFFTVKAVERPEFDAWIAERVATAAATPTPVPTPAPGATPAPVGRVIEVVSTQEEPLAFDLQVIEAKAGETLTVDYLNDSFLAHNIVFYEGSDASAPIIAGTPIVTGPDAPESVTFQAPTTPGTYYFNCQVHPIQMTGDFVVTP
jgi:cytochrome c oxidase subunit 2